MEREMGSTGQLRSKGDGQLNLKGVRRGIQAQPDPRCWGRVRRGQSVQGPECLEKSLSDWSD